MSDNIIDNVIIDNKKQKNIHIKHNKNNIKKLTLNDYITHLLKYLNNNNNLIKEISNNIIFKCNDSVKNKIAEALIKLNNNYNDINKILAKINKKKANNINLDINLNISKFDEFCNCKNKIKNVYKLDLFDIYYNINNYYVKILKLLTNMDNNISVILHYLYHINLLINQLSLNQFIIKDEYKKQVKN